MAEAAHARVEIVQRVDVHEQREDAVREAVRARSMTHVHDLADVQGRVGETGRVVRTSAHAATNADADAFAEAAAEAVTATPPHASAARNPELTASS